MIFGCTPYALTAHAVDKNVSKTNIYNEIPDLNKISSARHVVSENQPRAISAPLKLRLTGRTARRKCEGRDLFIWDAELPGFCLRLRATGSKRWILRFVERGRARVWTIGEPMFSQPDIIECVPLASLKGEGRAESYGFKGEVAAWPEVGSRWMQSLLSGDNFDEDGFLVVQPRVYRFRLDVGGRYNYSINYSRIFGCNRTMVLIVSMFVMRKNYL